GPVDGNGCCESIGMSAGQGEPPVTPTRGSDRLLSMVPSQSSSMPLHSSLDGPTSSVQVRPFGPGPLVPLQVNWAVHGPSVFTPPVEQFLPMPGTSSITPLQSSSLPLHTSVDFSTAPEHTRMPAWHSEVPVMQRVPVMVPVVVFWQSAMLP